MNINYGSGAANWLMGLVQHYNREKYWRRRDYVVHSGWGKTPQVLLSVVYQKV